MIRSRACLIGLALLVAREAPAGAQGIAPGNLAEGVACRGDSTQTYALYLPKAYSADRRWPLLFVFDPRGRGGLAARVFIEGAERYGWIVASSDNTMSDGPGEPNVRAVSAMWPDVLGRFAVDHRRIYTAAFSGTAVIGAALSRRPQTPIAGLIATGARNVDSLKYETLGVPWFGAAGLYDFNYLETRKITAMIARAGQPTRFVAFDGLHQWFPPEIGTRALAWFEVLAIKQQRRALDERLLDAVFGGEMEDAALLVERDPLDGLRRLEEIVVTFDGLRDVQGMRARASQLAAADAVKRLRSDEEKAERFERDRGRLTRITLQELIQRDSLPSVPEAVGELRVKDLVRRLAKGTREGDAAGRVLGLLLSQSGFYGLQEAERAGNIPVANLLRGIADAVRKELGVVR